MEDLELLSNIKIENTINSNDIFKHLSFVTDFLNELKIKHWIMYGTLLGCVRESNIIEYDYDFDIGIFYEDKDIVFKEFNNLEKYGYNLEYAKGCLYNINNIKNTIFGWRVSYKICYNNLAVGDIYIYKKCEDNYIRRFCPEENILFWPNTLLPYVFFETLDRKFIRDKLFFTPNNAELLVYHWYGPLWKIPIKASSQNGSNHEDYDYYGNYKFSSIKFLIDKLNEINEKEKKHDKLEVPKYFIANKNLNFFFFPLEQIDWLIENEGIVIDKKSLKLINKKLKQLNIK